MFRTTVAVAALGIMATPSVAQDLTYGALDLDYTNLSSDGGDDLSIFELDGDAELTYNQFVFGLGLSNENFDPEGGSNLTVRLLDLYAAYEITPEAMVGAGYGYTLLESGSDDTDLNGWDVFGQYQTNTFGVALSYARPDQDADDFNITTLFAEGEVSPGVKIGGFVESFSEVDENVYFLFAEYDMGQIFGRGYYTSITGEDFGIFGIRGAYGFTNEISLTGGIEATSGDDFGSEYTAASIGGEYEFAPGVAASARYTRIDIDSGGEADAFSLAVTYEMGARKRLDLNMFDDALEDLETGILGYQPNLGFGLLFGGF